MLLLVATGKLWSGDGRSPDKFENSRFTMNGTRLKLLGTTESICFWLGGDHCHTMEVHNGQSVIEEKKTRQNFSAALIKGFDTKRSLPVRLNP